MHMCRCVFMDIYIYIYERERRSIGLSQKPLGCIDLMNEKELIFSRASIIVRMFDSESWYILLLFVFQNIP